MPLGVGQGKNVGLRDFCNSLTLLPPGASVFYKHMSSLYIAIYRNTFFGPQYPALTEILKQTTIDGDKSIEVKHQLHVIDYISLTHAMQTSLKLTHWTEYQTGSARQKNLALHFRSKFLVQGTRKLVQCLFACVVVAFYN